MTAMKDFVVTSEHSFKEEAFRSPQVVEDITRKNPPKIKIVRKSEIEQIRAVSIQCKSLNEILTSIEPRKITLSKMKGVFPQLITLIDSMIELLPIFDDDALMKNLFGKDEEMCIELLKSVGPVYKALNSRMIWDNFSEKSTRIWLYGAYGVAKRVLVSCESSFSEYETNRYIAIINNAIKDCESFIKRVNKLKLETIKQTHDLAEESRELQRELESLFPEGRGNHSVGKKAGRIVTRLVDQRNNNFDFYKSSNYVKGVEAYVNKALAFTNMKLKSLKHYAGNNYPWEVYFIWPRNKKTYKITMSNNLKEFKFPFCVDHQNHTLIDAILVHLHSEGRSQDAVTL